MHELGIRVAVARGALDGGSAVDGGGAVDGGSTVDGGETVVRGTPDDCVDDDDDNGDGEAEAPGGLPRLEQT